MVVALLVVVAEEVAASLKPPGLALWHSKTTTNPVLCVCVCVFLYDD